MKNNQAAPSFRDLFGREPSASGRAPGRVNLIGEHTDYNGGYVLPTAIPQSTVSEVGLRSDRVVRAFSAGVDKAQGGHAILEYCLGEEARGGGFLDYIKGVTKALAEAGYRFPGFDLRVSSDVPVGGGLASSAALLVSVLRAIRTAVGLSLDDMAIALLGQRAENDLVGAPVGLMDHVAASFADTETALFFDTRSREMKRVPMPDEADLVVIDSGVTHSHAGGEYRTRRAECEEAATLLGVSDLRDLTVADLSRVMALPDPLGRRARHVIKEDDRVLAAVDALYARDLPRLGDLFYASHLSMRDDFEVSTPEIDMLVDIARADAAILGARLTGGGFGGAVVIFAWRGHGAEAGARIAGEYAARSGREPAVLVPPPESRPSTAELKGA